MRHQTGTKRAKKFLHTKFFLKKKGRPSLSTSLCSLLLTGEEEEEEEEEEKEHENDTCETTAQKATTTTRRRSALRQVVLPKDA